MTGPQLLALEATLAGSAQDLPDVQQVRYTYWPVNYFLGDPTVISAAPLPLSGVKFSAVMKGTGELRASLQLADVDVRAMNPWHLVLPRKTGIVVVRTSKLPDEEAEVHNVVWHGVVWSAPTDAATGRMEITARTVEYAWAQRLITGPMAGGDLVWAQKDRTVIVQDLLNPEKFSQIGPAAATATATGQGTSATTSYLIATDADAADILINDYVRLSNAAGDLKEPTVFRVVSKNSAAGFTNINFTPPAQEGTFAGDVMSVVKLFPGWINVDKPTVMTGKLHDFTYKRDQQTNLLEAHQDRSKVSDGYEWFTSVRVLDGDNAYDASAYRIQFVMGYPRLGREYGVDNIPRFSFYIDGRGNVVNATTVYDGSGVRNAMWGAGAGFDAATLRALATNSADWTNGFLVTEGKYSNPDVSVAATLQAYTNAALVQSYANERFLSGITVRGDMPPYFDSYAIGDDALYTTDDWGNPDRPDGTRDVTYITRIMGWTVTPPEGTYNETIELMLATGTEGGDDG